MSHPYESFMREAAELAERGRWSAAPNPTVGAVLVRDGVVVARGWHTAYGKSHAEVECLKDAEAKGVDPSACTLVVTLEPCTMCAGAIVASRVGRLVFGAFDEKAGAVASLRDVVRDPRLNHRPEVTGGVLEVECAAVLDAFFSQRRGGGDG